MFLLSVVWWSQLANVLRAGRERGGGAAPHTRPSNFDLYKDGIVHCKLVPRLCPHGNLADSTTRSTRAFLESQNEAQHALLPHARVPHWAEPSKKKKGGGRARPRRRSRSRRTVRNTGGPQQAAGAAARRRASPSPSAQLPIVALATVREASRRTTSASAKHVPRRRQQPPCVPAEAAARCRPPSPQREDSLSHAQAATVRRKG